MSKRVSLLLTLLVGVLGGTLIAGGALVGASAAPAPATSTTSVATTAKPKACVWKRLPAKLRADLKAARALPVGQRRAAVKKVLKSARAGHYGKRAERIVKHRAAVRRAFHHKLPAKLKAALKKARHLPVGERRPALKQIRKDVLAGKYGAKAQKMFEHRKAHRAACKASRNPTTA